MANKFSAEFYVNETRFLLQCPCNEPQWAPLCSCVKRALIKLPIPKHGLEVVVQCTTRLNNVDLPFSLTINPKGNPFR